MQDPVSYPERHEEDTTKIRAAVETSLEPPFDQEPLQTEEGKLEPTTPILPATYRRNNKIHLVSADITSFLRHDLNLTRLNSIHRYLWLAGLPTSPHSLHYQRLKKKEIVVADQFDLHLVWGSDSIFVKPFPRYLLSSSFWRQHLCIDSHLYQIALGFLFSYIALIEREVDFQIARNHDLIPAEITWQKWLVLTEGVLSKSAGMNMSHHNPLALVNPRFYYGELRLGRLNWIVRLARRQSPGYYSGFATCGTFVKNNGNTFIIVFAYMTIVLSAMQVGLATDFLEGTPTFGLAAYGFFVFAFVVLLGSAALFAGIVLLILTLFILDFFRTIAVRKKGRQQSADV